MTPEYKYSIVSTNVDGDKSTARFTNARSAHMWGSRLREEGMPFVVQKQGCSAELTLAELRKEASAEKPLKKKRNYRR